MKNWTLKKSIAVLIIAVICESIFAIPLRFEENLSWGLALLMGLGFWILLGAMCLVILWAVKTLINP